MKKSEHSVMNLNRQISWLFASVYSSLTVRIEVCSYELHICSVNKETRVPCWTLTVKLFHRYRIGTSNCYITVGSTKVFGNPPPNLYYLRVFQTHQSSIRKMWILIGGRSETCCYVLKSQCSVRLIGHCFQHGTCNVTDSSLLVFKDMGFVTSYDIIAASPAMTHYAKQIAHSTTVILSVIIFVMFITWKENLSLATCIFRWVKWIPLSCYKGFWKRSIQFSSPTFVAFITFLVFFKFDA